MIREIISRIRMRLSDVNFVGRSKALITIGTDRKNEKDSGYGDGGQDDVDSAMIDLVVGHPAEATNPDLVNDKSRIYIAEKTDPDDYFQVSIGDSVTGEPAIVHISDNVYIKARNKIKILNGNVSINIDSDGNIEIESSTKAEVKVGSSKILVNSSGIELDAGQGITGNVITDLDRPAHIDPITGATIFATFQPPGISTNNKVKVK